MQTSSSRLDTEESEAQLGVGPQPANHEEERAELERVLQHPEISRSANLVRFLSFICNRYFRGKTEDLREYTIAVEALGRKESTFDSHSDPIVRVTASALRKKLREIYRDESHNSAIEIVLPVGHYVPQFVRRPHAHANGHSASLSNGTISEVTAPPVSSTVPDATAVPHKAVFPWRIRPAVWIPVVSLLVLALVFFAGFSLGRHTDKDAKATVDALTWGDPVWSDDFDGAARQLPDISKWNYDTGNQNGWGNNEQEIYCSPRAGSAGGCDASKPNAFLDGDGHLVLRAERTADGHWTSARVTTRGLKDFQYGRIEARIKMPVGAGLWPAFWMLGANFNTVGWPASGSVSIAENVSLTPRSNGLGPTMIRSTLHGPRYFGGNGLWHDFKLPNHARVDDDSFHTYGIIWSPGLMQFYIDNPANVFLVQDASNLPEEGEWVFDKPFNLIFNLAVGGDWPGNPDATTPNPSDMLVDYVRVYKIPSVPAPTIQWSPVQVKAGSSSATLVTLHAPGNIGRVRLNCTTEPATATCELASRVVDFSDTTSQENTLTLSTDSFTDKGRIATSPGTYKLTITATTMSGNRSELTVPFRVSAN